MHAAKLGREAHVSVDGVRVLDPGAGDKGPAFSLELELVKAPKASSFKKLRRAFSSKSFQELQASASSGYFPLSSVDWWNCRTVELGGSRQRVQGR